MYVYRAGGERQDVSTGFPPAPSAVAFRKVPASSDGCRSIGSAPRDLSSAASRRGSPGPAATRSRLHFARKTPRRTPCPLLPCRMIMRRGSPLQARCAHASGAQGYFRHSSATGFCGISLAAHRKSILQLYYSNKKTKVVLYTAVNDGIRGNDAFFRIC